MNFPMPARVRRGFLVLIFNGLLPRVKSSENKWWARPVPAAAVTPAPLVALAFIGPKASVADRISFL